MKKNKQRIIKGKVTYKTIWSDPIREEEIRWWKEDFRHLLHGIYLTSLILIILLIILILK